VEGNVAYSPTVSELTPQQSNTHLGSAKPLTQSLHYFAAQQNVSALFHATRHAQNIRIIFKHGY